MAKHTGLGKGLDSLISTKYTKASSTRGPEQKTEKKAADPVPEGQDTLVKITSVSPNRNQPRKDFDEEALAELADSIKRHGIIQPLVVRKKGRGYEIIAGERRYRAAIKAGLKEIPVIIKDYSESELSEIALIENIQREDLNPIEEAQAYGRLIDEYKITQEELAERLSKSRSSITNHLRLLKLSAKVQQMVVDGKLSEGHARALVTVSSHEKQEKLADIIVSRGLSVRDTEQLVKKGPAKPRKKEKNADDLIYIELEEKLRELMSTKVSIKRESGEKGRILIEYYSLEELERLIDIFSKGR